MTTWTLLVSGWAVTAVLMAGFWWLQYRTRNAGIVDVVWAFATALLAIYFVLMEQSGSQARHFLIAAMVSLWGLRLGIFLYRRVSSESEDGRYRQMRTALGKWVQPGMFVFFQVQALWAVMFALPMWAASRAPAEGLQWNDFLGVAIWLIAMLGESIADGQLSRFRNDPRNKGKVCQTGLWRYSRHPNYFFEWLQWWAYVFIGIGSDVWWITLAGLAVMLIFLLKVTGIPFTEQQAVRSRGDAYRQYQKTTSAFFPLPPKQAQD